MNSIGFLRKLTKKPCSEKSLFTPKKEVPTVDSDRSLTLVKQNVFLRLTEFEVIQ